METDAENAVYEVLSSAPPSETNLLVVSYRRDPDEWLADWQRHVGTVPADFRFIHVGDVARSAAAPATDTPAGSAPHPVTAVNDPTDLTELGIQISQYLEQWAGTDRQITVYFDSLTVRLQFADLDRVYRFLHVLAGRVKSVDGHAYYRLDPDAHDAQTLSTVQTLMDDTIELP
jgi:hypothetical protein